MSNLEYVHMFVMGLEETISVLETFTQTLEKNVRIYVTTTAVMK